MLQTDIKNLDNFRNVKVESYLPGRLRLRVPSELRQNGAMTEAIGMLQSVPGIRQVQTNPVTGSVLVEFDPQVLDINHLLELGKAANLISADVATKLERPTGAEAVTGPSKITQGIIENFRILDAGVSRYTQGALDAKTLIPLVLITLALGRALVKRTRPVIPWYTLIWYGYSVFVHWNRQYAQKEHTGTASASNPAGQSPHPRWEESASIDVKYG
jgi:hypothetical protein